MKKIIGATAVALAGLSLGACGALPNEEAPTTTATVTASSVPYVAMPTKAAPTRHPSVDNPNLGTRNTNTIREALPFLQNVSDQGLIDSAEMTCNLLRLHDPLSVVEILADQLPDVPLDSVRVLALASQLEFCPETIDPEIFEN